MEPSRSESGRPHLLAASIAVLIATAILLTGRAIAIRYEQSAVAGFAPESFRLKEQGLVLQRAAAASAGVLSLYGSSELLRPRGSTASDFFRAAPTGFQVSPVGKGGATSLVVLQKIGALAGELRNRKVAVSISAVYFTASDIVAPWYTANFSVFAATQLTFGSRLDLALKRDIAARMIAFPQTLQRTPLLRFALRRLASGRRLDELIFYAALPLGKMQIAVLDLQDHYAALNYLRHRRKAPPARLPQIFDWPMLIQKAGESSAAATEQPSLAAHGPATSNNASAEKAFRETIGKVREWADFELLLRVLAQSHARPLLLSMPMDGPFYDATSVSRATRQEYYDKVRRLVQRYNFQVTDFSDHDEDSGFLESGNSQIRSVPRGHLSSRGWMFYNCALDHFFHDTVPQSCH
jgi:D-alanine transfer protein